jgi:His-Xaa-Ser system radical SAM maturase HxsC
MTELTARGRAVGFSEAIVGRIVRSPETDPIRRRESVYCEDRAGKLDTLNGYKALVTTRKIDSIGDLNSLPLVHSVASLDHLFSGDVVMLQPRTGLIRTMFRPASPNNALLLTERCNSFCLMCSQPPVDRDDSTRTEINLEVVRLMEPIPEHLNLTGGEPTLLGESLFRMFREITRRLPETAVHMLTNGRRFAWPQFTNDFVSNRPPKLTLGIPLYSDTASEHDYVVQARGAFDQTIQGLYQLARTEQFIEIRVVLHALTLPRLRSLAEFIYRSLPFAGHIALMGLEITGFTRPNLQKLWIDPFDYQQDLESAVEYLAVRGMNVSIYNHPLCILPRALWPFARKSISDWKNIYR